MKAVLKVAAIFALSLLGACGPKQDFASAPQKTITSASIVNTEPERIAQAEAQAQAAPPAAQPLQCVAHSGQACTATVEETEWTEGCPQNYTCAAYVGIWYGSATGCDRSGESCNGQNGPGSATYQSCTRPAYDRQHVGYVGARCTYIGNGTDDPFKGVADGQCHAAPDYPIANTYTQMVPGSGCKERPVHRSVQRAGRYGCDGVCRVSN